MRFLPDERLYRQAESCLAYLRRLPPRTAAPAAPERFHFYWHGPVGRKQAFAVKSVLATQPPGAADIWLWLDGENGYDGHADNPLLQPLLSRIQVRRYDPPAAAAGTPLADRPELYRPAGLALRSDAFRFLTLFRHGGTYLDLDVMLLRPWGELLAHFPGEFCYRWSARQPYGNSAVLRLLPASPTAAALLARCAAIGSCHPKHSLHFADQPNLDLLVLPCPFFDPLWPRADGKDDFPASPLAGFPEFFQPLDDRLSGDARVRSFRSFYAPAFAYHWHNGWEAPEHETSCFARFEAEFDAILERRDGIIRPADQRAA
ncbi:MAG: glycosyltransferase [Pirellulaceae bacterium]|nr:glycosyltransferase [Pirellulaceae bacterium]